MGKSSVVGREQALKELLELGHDGSTDHSTVSNPDFEAGFHAGYEKRKRDEQIEKRLPAIRKALR